LFFTSLLLPSYDGFAGMLSPRIPTTAAAGAGAAAAAASQADGKIVCRAVSCTNSFHNASNDHRRSSSSSRQQQQRLEALVRLITSGLGGITGRSSSCTTLSDVVAGEAAFHPQQQPSGFELDALLCRQLLQQEGSAPVTVRLVSFLFQ
jgi:hypothetical protein